MKRILIAGAKALTVALIAATIFSVVAAVMVAVGGSSEGDPRLLDVVLAYYTAAIGVALIVGALSPIAHKPVGRGATLLVSACFVAICMTIALHGLPSRWESKQWIVAVGVWAMLSVVGLVVIADERRHRDESST